MKNKKIVVTGGAGFIHLSFTRYLFKEHDNIEVVNYGRLTYAKNLDII